MGACGAGGGGAAGRWLPIQVRVHVRDAVRMVHPVAHDIMQVAPSTSLRPHAYTSIGAERLGNRPNEAVRSPAIWVYQLVGCCGAHAARGLEGQQSSPVCVPQWNPFPFAAAPTRTAKLSSKWRAGLWLLVSLCIMPAGIPLCRIHLPGPYGTVAHARRCSHAGSPYVAYVCRASATLPHQV